MKRITSLLLLVTGLIFGFAFPTPPDPGLAKLSDLENLDWYREGFNTYRPNRSAVRKLKKHLPAYRVLVFAGIWCTDTRSLLPQFGKVIQLTGFPEDRLRLYLLDETKNSPEDLEDTFDIKAIPTFIILKDGKELGRITEHAEKSIESDLFQLIRRDILSQRK